MCKGFIKIVFISAFIVLFLKVVSAQILVPIEYVAEYTYDGNIKQIIRKWGEWAGGKVGEGVLRPTTTEVVMKSTGEIVNVSTKLIVEKGGEGAVAKVVQAAAGKVMSKVIGAATVVFEILWPISTSQQLFLEECVGKDDCIFQNNKLFITEAPGSYVIKWNTLEFGPKSRCLAQSNTLILSSPEEYIKNLPKISSVPSTPNIWKGSWPLYGQQQFSDMNPGTYMYQLTCYTPGTGNWLTKFLDWISLFGQLTQEESIVRDLVVVQVKAPGPGPEPESQVTVDVKCNNSDSCTINQGKSVTVSWTSNGTSCTGRGKSYPAKSSFTDSPTVTTTYGMTCTKSGWNPGTDSVTVTVRDNTPPTGYHYHDGANNIACSTKGWARDADTPDKPVTVKIYDKSDGSDKLIASDKADKPRPESAWPFPDRNHGFDIPLPSLKDGKIHDLHAYAVDTTSPGNVTLLKLSPRLIQCSAPITTPGPSKSYVDIKVQ